MFSLTLQMRTLHANKKTLGKNFIMEVGVLCSNQKRILNVHMHRQEALTRKNDKELLKGLRLFKSETELGTTHSIVKKKQKLRLFILKILLKYSWHPILVSGVQHSDLTFIYLMM